MYNHNMLPLIDLHVHVEGSLTSENVIELAKMGNVPLPTTDAVELKKYLTSPMDISSITEYYKHFDLSYDVLQAESTIERGVFLLLQNLAQKGVVYSEIHITPQYHLKNGLYQETVVQAALRGMEAAKSDFLINSNLILCFNRGLNNDEENLETLRVAAKYLHRGVCAVDLVGQEDMFPTVRFKPLFRLSSNMDVPFTIHAGKARDLNSVRDAITFGARRIGHGCSAAMDETLMESMRYRNIGIECCVTSNIQTKSATSIQTHPIWTFLQHGIMCSVNSDLMVVADTDVKQEYSLLSEDSRFSDSLKVILLKNAVYTSFMEDSEKQSLLKKIDEMNG